MKRKALLIGNTNGLAGVAKDLKNMTNFLKSNYGGAWVSNEIIELQNPTKNDVSKTVLNIKSDKPDFVIVLFSGHGAHSGQTLIELNGNGELYEESKLFNLATRQISIFDCCRAAMEKSYALDSLSEVLNFADNSIVRAAYDERILKAIPQQVKLYSCQVGEVSYDTPKGAVYLSELIASASNLESFEEDKTVEKAHDQAKLKTILYSGKQGQVQTPDAILPKCIKQQQLIISLNPKKIEVL